ncbi:hypothetical protein EDB89DRAFT_1972693, partial [Lactarius sanguifluus]
MSFTTCTSAGQLSFRVLSTIICFIPDTVLSSHSKPFKSLTLHSSGPLGALRLEHGQGVPPEAGAMHRRQSPFQPSPPRAASTATSWERPRIGTRVGHHFAVTSKALEPLEEERTGRCSASTTSASFFLWFNPA